MEGRDEYCLYLRKSRADKELEAMGEMETLARHEKILLELAKKQKLTVTKIYKEIVSGETISARPVVRQLLEEVEDGRWKGVLVMEIERLARGDTIDQGIVARAFKTEDTKIITPSKTYDPSNEFDEEYFEFGLFISRREYKTINRRIQRGRLQSAREGKFIASVPPFGYEKVRIENDKGYTLKPQTQEADVVQFIFQQYLAGEGCTVIANRLDSMKVPTRSGRVWSKSTVRDILRNPVYNGKIRWSYKIEKKTSIGKKTVINAEPIYVNGLHEALISDEDFEKVQTIMGENQRPPVKGDATLKNQFTGIAYCGICGSRMERLGPNSHCPYDTLRCSNRYCHNVSAPMNLIEEEVLRQIRVHMEKLRVHVNSQKNSKTENLELQQKSIHELEIKLQTLNQQVEKTYDFLEQGVYSTEEFVARQDALAKQKTEIQSAINKLKNEYQKSEKRIVYLQELPKLFSLLSWYDFLNSAQDKNNILRQLIKKFEYTKEIQNHRGHRDEKNFRIVIFPQIPLKGI